MTPPTWPHGDPRDVARAIVADPKYHVRASAPAAQSWVDALRGWINGLLRDLLHVLDRALSAASPLNGAIGVAVIAAAFGLLALCVVILVRVYAGRIRGKRAGRVAGPPTASQPRSAQALREAANTAARAGRFRDAAALLFLSAVRALDERGRIGYDPARTPGEYRRLVRDPVFDALAGDAVIALFAATEPRPDLFERMNNAYDRFFAPARLQ